MTGRIVLTKNPIRNHTGLNKQRLSGIVGISAACSVWKAYRARDLGNDYFKRYLRCTRGLSKYLLICSSDMVSAISVGTSASWV